MVAFRSFLSLGIMGLLLMGTPVAELAHADTLSPANQAAVTTTLLEIAPTLKHLDPEWQDEIGMLTMALGRTDLIPRVIPNVEGRNLEEYMSGWLAIKHHDLVAAQEYASKLSATDREELDILMALEQLRGLTSDELRERAATLLPPVERAWSSAKTVDAAFADYGPPLALAKFRLGDSAGARAWFVEAEHRNEKIFGPNGELERVVAWQRLYRAESAAGLEGQLLEHYPNSTMIQQVVLHERLTRGDLAGARSLLQAKTPDATLQNIVEKLEGFGFQYPLDESDPEQVAEFAGAASTYQLGLEMLPRIKHLESRGEFAAKLATIRVRMGYAGEALQLLRQYPMGRPDEELRTSIKKSALEGGAIPRDISPQTRVAWLREFITSAQKQIQMYAAYNVAWSEYVNLAEYQIMAGDYAAARKTLQGLERRLGPIPKTPTSAEIKAGGERISWTNEAARFYPTLARLWREAKDPAKASEWVQRAVKNRVYADEDFPKDLAANGHWDAAINVMLRGPINEWTARDFIYMWKAQKPKQFPSWVHRLKTPQPRIAALIAWVQADDDPDHDRFCEFLYQSPG
jgi:hypothetical protein